MSEIYRRYEAMPQQQKKPSPQHAPMNKLSEPNSSEKPCQNPQPIPPPPKNNRPKSAKTTDFLRSFIPKNIYNPETKKILGFLEAEDLLIIALIFLFLESSEDDNPLMVLALVYILLGEYIDFGDFAF